MSGLAELFHTALDAYNHRDREAWLAMMDPEVENHPPREWPETWKQGDLELALSYRFEPGAEHDGVTVHVPLALLGQLRPDRFEWLVPGLREELVTTLLRSLPKELRRPLVPVPDSAAPGISFAASQ